MLSRLINRFLLSTSFSNRYSFTIFHNQNDRQYQKNSVNRKTIRKPERFKKNNEYPENKGRKLFNTQEIFAGSKFDQYTVPAEETDNNVQEMVKTINEINREFLGIKINTDYFKVYNEKTFQQICKPTINKKYTINDVPFKVISVNSQNKTSQIQPQESTLKYENKQTNTKAQQMFSKMISQQRIISRLQSLAKGYFVDLIKKERNILMQPNFQAEARKVISTMKAMNYQFTLSNENENKNRTPEVDISKVTVFKGVKVNRNDNYCLDAYSINYEEQQEGVITYTLNKKERQQYPESQWFAQKFIMMRLETEVTNVPMVEIKDAQGNTFSNKDVKHRFVFEVDLTVPPSLAMLSLNAEEYLNSYRLKLSDINISNVDNRSLYYKVAYNENEKKYNLINKIV